MKKKKDKKQDLPVTDDFYGEQDAFSDDPQESFYATSEEEDSKTFTNKKNNRLTIWGFYKWELAVIFIELILIIYLILVFLGQAPLF